MAKMILFNDPNYKSFLSVLAKPWFTGCPIGKLPFMPIERNNRAELLFIVLFVFIWVN
jgi:hypothetical protein